MHVEFTLSTAPMLLLAAYLWFRAKGQLLPVAMFMSVFQAASVVNLGFGSFEIGVQPAYLILVAALVARFAGRRPRKTGNWIPSTSTTLLLAAFVAYATVSAFIFPLLFKGVLISNPKFGFGVPLKWEFGHLNQVFYLLLSFAMYLVAAYWTPPAELSKSVNWFVGGVVFASLIGLYQLISIKTGLPFPRDFLDTSPTYSIFGGYEIDGFPRMNSTFTEAAAAAFSMNVALAIVLWRFLSRPDSLRNLAYVCLIGMGLLLTISTTGYVCLAFLLVIAGTRYFARWKGSSEARTARVLLWVPVVLFLLVSLGVPAIRDSFVKLAHTVLLDKTNTLSYQQRAEWNLDALKTAADTHWLGAGWGVCRASSFLPTVLGNVGIPGTGLIFAFCVKLLWPATQLNKLKLQLHGAVLVALSAVLLDLMASAPELANPVIWLLFAVAAKLASDRTPPFAQVFTGPMNINPAARRLQATA
jgi:hypothetical protein